MWGRKSDDDGGGKLDATPASAAASSASYAPLRSASGVDDSDDDDDDDDDAFGGGFAFPPPDDDGAEEEEEEERRGGGGGGEDEDDDDEDDDVLRPGDHVFCYEANAIGIPRARQRHAIVLSVKPRECTNSFVEEGDDDDDDGGGGGTTDSEDSITVVSFYPPEEKAASAARRRGEGGGGVGVGGVPLLRGGSPADGAAAAAENDEGDDDGAGDGSGSGGTTTTTTESRVLLARQEPLSRFLPAPSTPIRKVKYDRGFVRRLLSRGGTTTAIPSDPASLVLSRVRHLLDRPHLLPPGSRSSLSANDECAAVWCSTGKWVTLQGASVLGLLAAGQASSAAVAGGIVSHLTVTYAVPWGGWVWIWTVPATVAYPFLIPLLIGYGLCSLAPLEVLRRHRKKWKAISDELNRDFWSELDCDAKAEYFGKTMCSDRRSGGNAMGRFFGMAAGSDGGRGGGGGGGGDGGFEGGEGSGMYMPVNLGTEEDEEEDDDGGDGGVRREARPRAAFRDEPASSAPPPTEERRRRRLLGRGDGSGSFRARWADVASRWTKKQQNDKGRAWSSERVLPSGATTAGGGGEEEEGGDDDVAKPMVSEDRLGTIDDDNDAADRLRAKDGASANDPASKRGGKGGGERAGGGQGQALWRRWTSERIVVDRKETPPL